jgi:hypothetical protein
MPVVKNQHLLLCTLLIGNSLAMEVTSAPALVLQLRIAELIPAADEINLLAWIAAPLY